MRFLVLAICLPLAVSSANADTVDCRDYMARFEDLMREVSARAPGIETDARREKAESLVRDCKRQERREAREAAEDNQVLVPVPYPVPVPLDCVRNGVRVPCEGYDRR